jgi:RNA 2',3'-cyclic 3'-phosphodiesterase
MLAVMGRLFVAFSIPDAIRAALRPALDRLDRGRLAVVPEENLHVTVAFLGERDDLDLVTAALEQASQRCAPSTVRLDALGAFPRPSHARVLFAGIADPEGSLHADAHTLRAALAEEPIRWIARDDFVPHITLARVRRGRRPMSAAPDRLSPASFTVRSVELFHSVLQGRRPPRYDVLASFPFARSSPSSQAGACP